jgi:hypothetical protein
VLVALALLLLLAEPALIMLAVEAEVLMRLVAVRLALGGMVVELLAQMV